MPSGNVAAAKKQIEAQKDAVKKQQKIAEDKYIALDQFGVLDASMAAKVRFGDIQYDRAQKIHDIPIPKLIQNSPEAIAAYEEARDKALDKDLEEARVDWADVADKARQKKLGPDDLRGGTFTITNLGGIGGIGFTPIINYPEVAILGLSRGRLQPVVRDGQIVTRLLLPLSLSYDHRVVDGADAARFTRRVADMLENPLVMLLYA